jgi:hypothetical protein
VERIVVVGIDVGASDGTGNVVASSVVACTTAAAERVAGAEGNHDANGVCRPWVGRRQRNSGKVGVCASTL